MDDALEKRTIPGAKAGENNENNLKNISPFMSKNLIAAAGFNVETPIVNAIIGNLTGTLPTKKSETEMIKCEVCSCELSSGVVFELHINGSKHKKRLKALEIISQLNEKKLLGLGFEKNSMPNSFRCDICLVTVNSAQQLEVHLSGAKHKRKVARVNSVKKSESGGNKHKQKINSESVEEFQAKKRKLESKLICCDTCKVFLNSKTQYEQHIISKRHCNKAKS